MTETFEEIISKTINEELEVWRVKHPINSVFYLEFARACILRYKAQLEKQIENRKLFHEQELDDILDSDPEADEHYSAISEDEVILGILKAEKTEK